jgi:hypothetical protein
MSGRTHTGFSVMMRVTGKSRLKKRPERRLGG